MRTLWPVLNRLDKRCVKVYILTRDPAENNERYEEPSESEIEICQHFYSFLLFKIPSPDLGI